MENSKNADIKVDGLSVSITQPKEPLAVLVLAHGAGAGMHHAFMEELASALNQRKIITIRFNFPYMDAGKKLPGSPKPNKEAIIKISRFASEQYPDIPLFLSGKSYGGRMSAYVMAETPIDKVKGLIFYGFPLHAPGKPTIKRAEQLKSVSCPMLFIQGSNDKLADLNLLTEVIETLPTATLKTFEKADHSFKRPKKVSKASLVPDLADATYDWIIKHI